MILHNLFSGLRERKESALIAYFTGGFPTLAASAETIRTLAENGTDLIEIGVPFSDPVADGPVIQQASTTALQNGATLRGILDMVRGLNVDIPLVLMSYLNPLLAYGWSECIADARAAGVSGFIVPDLPVDAADTYLPDCRDAGLDLIFLAAPTSTDSRIRAIAKKGSGFIYAVSVTGTTGVREGLPQNLPDFVERIRGETALPVAVGFGVSKAEQIQTLSPIADGVIIGSRLIRAVMDGEDLSALVRNFKSATRRSSEETS